MSEQDATQKTTLQYPDTNDKEAWIAYWKAQSQDWRTEPEIDAEWQKYLAERRSITPDIEKGIYPFSGIKLSRADVEWLLATHENGCGPVDWSDKSQHKRKGLDLRGADLHQVDLHNLPLACLYGGLHRSYWIDTTLEQHTMAELHLERVNLRGAHLEAACLARVHLEGADIVKAHLEGADLYQAHLEGADLTNAYLGGASLRSSYLDAAANLSLIILEDENLGITLTSDMNWNSANLAVVNWKQLRVLGEENVAKQPTLWNGQVKNDVAWLRGYLSAVRANRQLAVALQAQGLNEDAARFTYRSQLIQRKVFKYQGKFGQYLFSLFLDLLAGYGYKPSRSFVAYLLVITTFGIAYFIIGQEFGPVLSPLGSFVFSMTSFHGRGFFPGGIGLDDPLTVVAAFEAFIGLLIEVTFIATLTQRLFGK